MSTSIILQQMGVIVILVSIGIYLYKKGTVDSTVSPRLSSIVVDVCNPALILASILSGNITATHKDLLIGMVIGVIFYAFLIVLGLILPRILRSAPDDRRYYNMMTIYTNTGFIGIPVARAHRYKCNVQSSFLYTRNNCSQCRKRKDELPKDLQSGNNHGHSGSYCILVQYHPAAYHQQQYQLHRQPYCIPVNGGSWCIYCKIQSSRRT